MARTRTTSEERSRRRFARRQWARRWLTWRYVVAFAVVVVVVVGGVYLVFFSSALSVQGAEVSGTQTLTKQQVLAAADVPTGGPLATVDLGAIKRRVAALASVRSVDVTRSWPHDVHITIVERTPVAAIEIGKQFRSLDEDGVVFGTYARKPSGLPLVETSDSLSDTDGLREAARVAASLPRVIAVMTDHVELRSADDVELDLTEDRVVRWGSSADSATKARVLAVLLRHKAKVYDVSVPGSPTTSNTSTG